jgi:hypothetical protein
LFCAESRMRDSTSLVFVLCAHGLSYKGSHANVKITRHSGMDRSRIAAKRHLFASPQAIRQQAIGRQALRPKLMPRLLRSALADS